MNNDYTQRLEGVIKQMLQPLKNIPFNLVIESLSGYKVLPFKEHDREHIDTRDLLSKAAMRAGEDMNTNPIVRLRANEVGNDIEPYVKRALGDLGAPADIPKARSRQGFRGKSIFGSTRKSA